LKRLDPETRLRRRVLRALARLRRLQRADVALCIRWHVDGIHGRCSLRCRVAACDRELGRLAELLAEGKGE